MASFRNFGVAFLVAVLSLGLQGCEKSNLCKQSLPLLGPLICKVAAVGPGGCASLHGAHVAKADSVAACQDLCSKKKDCKYYSFCSDPAKCGKLYKDACGLIVNEKCTLATSLGRSDLTTFQMYDANIHTPHSQTSQVGIGFVAGLAAAGAFAMVSVRCGRRSAQYREMESLEEANGEE
jgi:hypothetical protein